MNKNEFKVKKNKLKFESNSRNSILVLNSLLEYIMKAVIQRVNKAFVSVNEIVIGKIERGILVYLGVARDDTEKDAEWLAEKIANIRIFNDSEGKMNLSLKDLNEEKKRETPLTQDASNSIGVLAISQFTLLADARKGRRPSWNGAAPPEKAKQLYEYFIGAIKERGLICESGEFQAHMMVSYINDGPVTIILDTSELSLTRI